MRRYGLRDDPWEQMEGFLLSRKGSDGRPAKDSRLFVEAVLYRYRAGNPTALHLMAGQASDFDDAEAPLDALEVPTFITDKRHDAHEQPLAKLEKAGNRSYSAQNEPKRVPRLRQRPLQTAAPDRKFFAKLNRFRKASLALQFMQPALDRILHLI